MAPSSQGLEPPGIPVRFNGCGGTHLVLDLGRLVQEREEAGRCAACCVLRAACCMIKSTTVIPALWTAAANERG